jgi:putative hemolysin
MHMVIYANRGARHCRIDYLVWCAPLSRRSNKSLDTFLALHMTCRHGPVWTTASRLPAHLDSNMTLVQLAKDKLEVVGACATLSYASLVARTTIDMGSACCAMTPEH